MDHPSYIDYEKENISETNLNSIFDYTYQINENDIEQIKKK